MKIIFSKVRVEMFYVIYECLCPARCVKVHMAIDKDLHNSLIEKDELDEFLINQYLCNLKRSFEVVVK